MLFSSLLLGWGRISRFNLRFLDKLENAFIQKKNEVNKNLMSESTKFCICTGRGWSGFFVYTSQDPAKMHSYPMSKTKMQTKPSITPDKQFEVHT